MPNKKPSARKSVPVDPTEGLTSDTPRPPTREERVKSIGVPEVTTVLVDDTGTILWFCEHVHTATPGPCDVCLKQGRITEKTRDFIYAAGIVSQHGAQHPEQAEKATSAVRKLVEFANDYIDRRMAEQFKQPRQKGA